MKWRNRTGLSVVGLTAALFIVAGCGDDGGGIGGNNNTNHVIYADSGVQQDSSTPQPDAATGPCDYNGFNAVTEIATYSQGFLHYQAYNAEGFPTDRVSVQIYDSFNGPTTPGSYTLEGSTDDNYETCGLCPLLYTYTTAGDPDKIFYADTGTVQISSIGAIGGTFAATFQNLIFREVTIDSGTFRSTPVPNGEEWCLNGYNFHEPIQDDSAVCAQPGTCIGDSVNDFQMTSCETGNSVSAFSLMAGANALWLVGSHEW